MRFRANLTSVTNPRIEVHALLSRFHPSWKGLVEGTCRHPAGLQHRCSACEKLELCITSDKYNLFYQTTWFLRINLGVFRRLVNFVPNKRFKRNQMTLHTLLVPPKTFSSYKTCFQSPLVPLKTFSQNGIPFLYDREKRQKKKRPEREARSDV